MKYFIKLLISISFTTNCFAFGISSFENLNFQFGSWLENYQQVQSTQSGSKNGFEFNPYLALGLDYKLRPSIYLTPEIGYIFQRTSEDIRKNQFFIRTDLSYLANDWLKLKLGTSLMILVISGDGGEDTLPNGNSTETYYIPEERRTAYNQTLDFGAEFFKDNMSARVQSYLYAWNESEERMITYSLSFNYNIKIKDLL